MSYRHDSYREGALLSRAETTLEIADAKLRERDWESAYELFRRDREIIFAALFARSLLATYTSPTGSAVLDLRAHNVGAANASGSRTVTMTGDSLARLRGTAQFVDAMFGNKHVPFDANDTEFFFDATKGKWLDRIAHVHDRVRTLIDVALLDPEVPVDVDLFRNPIGLEQLLGSWVSFVVPVVETLEEQFNRKWTRNERDTWARVWFEITAYQGLSEAIADADDEVIEKFFPEEHQFFPELSDDEPRRIELADITYATAQHMHDVIRQRHWKRTLSGVRLADNLIRDLEDALPNALRWTVRIGAWVLGDPEVNRLLMVPSHRYLTPLASVYISIFPADGRRFSRWYVKMMLKEMYRTQHEAHWDQRFPPNPKIPPPEMAWRGSDPA